MKKLPLSIAMLLLSVLSSYGQELPSLVPPTPESRKIIEYGNVPVTYNTGVNALNFPLYALNVNRTYGIPITISYHGSGVKIDSPDGYVGLKWSLNNGSGVISRSIKGRPDESTRYGVNNG